MLNSKCYLVHIVRAMETSASVLSGQFMMQFVIRTHEF